MPASLLHLSHEGLALPLNSEIQAPASTQVIATHISQRDSIVGCTNKRLEAANQANEGEPELFEKRTSDEESSLHERQTSSARLAVIHVTISKWMHLADKQDVETAN